ncbi:lamin tail domain-containing protein [Emticicia sp. TH156]|uniref:lamin tail domain-containing protein n=1 Tax=Emticicia sp. TH156 TaxID=2067454 RepID=UPI000C773283|nr:lamin tail domain-containing protein [Emticicia sp. TH156]PLK45686.1 hypothetical protein C0V77_06070 [Emticicia sp. TH156]
MTCAKPGCRSILICTFCILLLFINTTLAQQTNELIISEIMADPTPAKGLPEKEYLELYNRSGKALNLNQFVLGYNNSTVSFPDFIIQPKEYVIVTNRNNVSEFQAIGRTVGLSSFSLLNTGTTLTLKTNSNRTVFSVTYTSKWYSTGKTQGFSLEMIDTEFACVETGNWVSSEAVLQGTPGKENSVKASRPDLTPPVLQRYEYLNNQQIKLVFNEKLDSLSAVSQLAYTVDKSVQIKSIVTESPANTSVTLTFQSDLQTKTSYTLTARNVADCSGNVLKEASLQVGIVSEADSGDVVLNEILFNPGSGGEDFVEIYNRSNKFISLKNWALANADNTGTVGNIKPITLTNYVLMPGQFLVLTRNASVISSQYYKTIASHILEMESLPAFANEKGTVVLLNQLRKVLDRFDYSETMHHGLIDNKAGVSLEKSDYNLPSSLPSNWHSAAASDGYATPGYANSQYKSAAESNTFMIEPEVFTPDGDGSDDVAQLKFQLTQTGFVANLYVFDANGRMLKQLAQNQILGVNDQIVWDGKSYNNELAPVGYYIILAELFNTNGEKLEFKAKVVLGAKY